MKTSNEKSKRKSTIIIGIFILALLIGFLVIFTRNLREATTMKTERERIQIDEFVSSYNSKAKDYAMESLVQGERDNSWETVTNGCTVEFVDAYEAPANAFIIRIYGSEGDSPRDDMAKVVETMIPLLHMDETEALQKELISTIEESNLATEGNFISGFAYTFEPHKKTSENKTNCYIELSIPE